MNSNAHKSQDKRLILVNFIVQAQASHYQLLIKRSKLNECVSCALLFLSFMKHLFNVVCNYYH